MADSIQLAPAAELAKKNGVRFPNESDEYRRARDALLAEEIELRRHIERVAEQRRALPPGGAGDQGLSLRGRGGAGRASPTCSATSRRSPSTATCSARSASGPARCAPRCSAPGTARRATSSSASRSRWSPARRSSASSRSRRSAAGGTSGSTRTSTGEFSRDYHALGDGRRRRCGVQRLHAPRRHDPPFLERRDGLRDRRSRARTRAARPT